MARDWESSRYIAPQGPHGASGRAAQSPARPRRSLARYLYLLGVRRGARPHRAAAPSLEAMTAPGPGSIARWQGPATALLPPLFALGRCHARLARPGAPPAASLS